MTQPVITPDGAWQWNPDSQSWRPRGNSASGAPQASQVAPLPASRPRAAAGRNVAGVLLMLVGIVVGVALWLMRILTSVLLGTHNNTQGWWMSDTLEYALAAVGAVALVCAVLGAVISRGRSWFLVIVGLVVASSAFGDHFAGAISWIFIAVLAK